MNLELSPAEIEMLLALARQATTSDDAQALLLAQLRVKLALALETKAGK